MMKKLHEWDVAFWNWFNGSGTILWARVQMLFGVLMFAATSTDITQLSFFREHPNWVIYWAMLNGFVTEYVRRRNTETVMIPTTLPDGTPVQVRQLIQAPPPGSTG